MTERLSFQKVTPLLSSSAVPAGQEGPEGELKKQLTKPIFFHYPFY